MLRYLIIFTKDWLYVHSIVLALDLQGFGPSAYVDESDRSSPVHPSF
jgi:hypothetical protein